MSIVPMTESRVLERYTQEKVDLVKRTVAKGATDDELALFIQVCERTGLDPFARQIYAIKRWDSSLRREVMQTQISIDGARLVAQRSGRYAGQVPIEWCGNDKVWTDVWLDDDAPRAARAGVYMVGAPEPIWAVATWDSYVQTKKDGSVTAMWGKFGPLMLGKCAEMLALRKAFPMELSGLYSAEEMSQAEEPRPVPDRARAPQQSAGRTRRRRPEPQAEAPADGEVPITAEHTALVNNTIDALDKDAKAAVTAAWIAHSLPGRDLVTEEQFLVGVAIFLEAGVALEGWTLVDGNAVEVTGDGEIVDAEIVEEPAGGEEPF
jgi:phage recombination protein Bet